MEMEAISDEAVRTNLKSPQAEFIPPEPSALPPGYDSRFVPRWVEIVLLILFIVIDIMVVIFAK